MDALCSRGYIKLADLKKTFNRSQTLSFLQARIHVKLLPLKHIHILTKLSRTTCLSLLAPTSLPLVWYQCKTRPMHAPSA